MAEMERIEVAGRYLEHAWFGPPADGGPVVVMLHEGLGCLALWRDFPEQIAVRTGRPVFAYSRLGYGNSDPSRLPKTTRYMHDEALQVLPALLQAAEIRDYILFGHSDGASIALIFAGGTDASGLRAMILEAPHVYAETRCLHSIRAAKIAFKKGELRDRLAKYHGANVNCAFYGWADPWTDPEFEIWDLREYLDRIGVPILLLQGEDDEYGTSDQLTAIEQAVPVEVNSVLLADCGHSPHGDQPAMVLNAASNFIRAHC